MKIYAKHQFQSIAAVVLFATLLIGGCESLGLPSGASPTGISTTQVDTPEPALIEEALIHFRVQIPETPPPEQGIQLNILDEVTGLALNISGHDMQPEDSTHYSVEIPFPLGSVIKYRYTRKGSIPAEEHTSDGRQVRYRMFLVEAPGTVEDLVTRWTDSTYEGPTGRIQGQVFDQETRLPQPNILIASGGAQTMTAADGTFLIEGLPPGVHNLIAYSLDGAYQVFQQGAQVAPDATTPAEIHISKAPLVNLTFHIKVPKGTPPVVPVRIAGNLYQLGNTFANLSGGMSTTAARMPALVPQPDGTYKLTLSLPAGTDLRYKYTLGDGFWNAEHTDQQSFLLRQLIIPDSDLLINDEVYSWSDTDGSYITFDAMAPEDTPPGENVSIQFNPYAWTEPIPMWSLQNNRWVFFLYSPLRPLHTLAYRYCRNEQCNAADAINTVGYDNPGLPVDLENPQGRGQDSIPGWAWLDSSIDQAIDPASELTPHPEDFVRGIELQAAYNPTWQSKLPYALDDINRIQANWLVLSPTWSYTRTNPPVLEQVSGQDALWLDMYNAITLSERAGLQTALYPHPQFQMPAIDWWASGNRDFPWWVVWFERYRVFLLHHAELASRSGVQSLILGGEWLAPAMPGGTLPDGTPSGVPEDAEARWRGLIAEVRQNYSGQILWALPYQAGSWQLPPFLDAVDGIYLLWSSRLTDQVNPDVQQMTEAAGQLLDNEVKPAMTNLGKPVYLAISYPSAQGGVTGCVTDPRGGCLDVTELNQPRPDNPLIPVDYSGQALAYRALLQAVNSRDWISGLVSQGYYPPAILMDKSISIHGKPAAEVLADGFQRWESNP
jgi:hypothetical protein